jgi:hypothetical protein
MEFELEEAAKLLSDAQVDAVGNLRSFVEGCR